VGILNNEEVVGLYDRTNWSSPFKAQWMNMLILADQIGQRPANIFFPAPSGQFARRTG
jgi:hypothetical protein